MTKKELRLIRGSITNAMNAIELLACDNYPYTGFNDDDFRKMYYQLNGMCLKICEKMENLAETG